MKSYEKCGVVKYYSKMYQKRYQKIFNAMFDLLTEQKEEFKKMGQYQDNLAPKVQKILLDQQGDKMF